MGQWWSWTGHRHVRGLQISAVGFVIVARRTCRHVGWSCKNAGKNRRSSQTERVLSVDEDARHRFGDTLEEFIEWNLVRFILFYYFTLWMKYFCAKCILWDSKKCKRLSTKTASLSRRKTCVLETWLNILLLFSSVDIHTG